MPGFVMHVQAGCQCAHSVPAKIVPTQTRVLVIGQPVATMDARILVTGCPFTLPGPVASPCLTIQWSMPSARVRIMGKPAMVVPGPGAGPAICQNGAQAPQGPPIIGAVENRVIVM
jgi:hypothetical protein